MGKLQRTQVLKTAFGLIAAMLIVSANTARAAEDATAVARTLITNARIFDGQHEQLADGMSVLVEGNRIIKIAKSITPPVGATVIDAKGRVLMPGLIDAHWHSMFCFSPVSNVLSADFGTLSIEAAKAAEDTLQRGFTTVRDVGGNVFPVNEGY